MRIGRRHREYYCKETTTDVGPTATEDLDDLDDSDSADTRRRRTLE